jgi:conjugal transfer pilus assembly protein TrbC
MIRRQAGRTALEVLIAASAAGVGAITAPGCIAQTLQPGSVPQSVPRPPSAKGIGVGIDRLPQPLPGAPVDIAAVARGFDAAGTAAAAQALFRGPQLLVFVSLSMPQGSLRRLIEQGERSRAVLVLRGLKEGSMVKTAVAVRELLGGHKTAIQIDPQGFDRFGVSQVPTFVLLKDGTQLQHCADASCLPPAAYVQVAGDVTIDYALEWIGERSSGFNREARQLLQRMRE